mgnify:CR=1 FL=1
MKRISRILLCVLMITVLCGISIVGNSVVKSENKSKEKKRTVITKEEMEEWDAPEEEMLEYYDLGKFSTTLPVIYMNTMGQQILKENAIWKYCSTGWKRRGAICFLGSQFDIPHDDQIQRCFFL